MARVTKSMKVMFEWTYVSPDPNQYKPYNPRFDPVKVMIEVEVPIKHPDSGKVLVVGNKTVNRVKHQVLTPDGMAYAIKELSLALRRAWMNKKGDK